MTGKQLREKGKMYWTNWEVTGHVDSAGGVPKFSLLKHFRDSLIPALEEKARKYNCIVKFQFDGAGPHNDKELLKFLRDEFAKRGWIFKFQPSQRSRGEQGACTTVFEKPTFRRTKELLFWRPRSPLSWIPNI